MKIATWQHLIVITCTLACSGLFAADNWHHYRGPQMDGKSQVAGIDPAKYQKAWETKVHTGFSGIIYNDDKLFTMGNDSGTEYVLALDAKTGKTLWSHSYKQDLMPNLYEGGPNATPTYHEGKLYTLSRNGDIFCLDAESGKVVWKAHAADYGAKPPDWGFSGFATVLGDAVYFNVGDHGLALNKDSGKVIWSSKGKGAGYAGPVPFWQAGKQALAMFTARGLKAVLPADGSTLWEFEWKTSYDVNAAAPIFLPDGNRIFISSGYRTGCVMLEMKGTKVRELWRSDNLATQFSTAVFIDGYIYGIHGDANRRGSLVCMKADDGSVAWYERLGFGSLVANDNKLLVLNERGKLFTVEANHEAYKQLDERELLSPRCWTVPTIVAGALYARNSYGNMVRLNLK